MDTALSLIDDAINHFEANSVDKRKIDFDYEKISKFVNDKLVEVCKEHQNEFRVLYCVEASSHVWGTSHMRSDNDVKSFIYHKARDYYSPTKQMCSYWKYQYGPRDLSNQNAKEIAEEKSDDPDVELSFMQIKKVCQLILKNDSNIFEMLTSPVTYLVESEEFVERLREIMYSLYDYRKLASKYLGFSQGNYKQVSSNKKKRFTKKPLKILFYVWRGLLGAEWLLNHQSCKGLPLHILDRIESSKILQNAEKQVMVRLITTKLNIGVFEIECDDSRRLLIDTEQKLKIVAQMLDEHFEQKSEKNEKRNEASLQELEQLVFEVIESFK